MRPVVTGLHTPFGSSDRPTPAYGSSRPANGHYTSSPAVLPAKGAAVAAARRQFPFANGPAAPLSSDRPFHLIKEKLAKSMRDALIADILSSNNAD